MKVTSSILLAFILYNVNSQSIQFLGVKSHYGSIIPHSEELKEISESNPFGFQGEIGWLKTEDEAWKTCNCYGKTGVSFAFFNYKNPSQLGRSYNFLYFAEPYLLYRGKSKLSLRSAVGVSYLDRVFDSESNPENLFFSAPLSFFLSLNLTYNLHISDDFVLNTSINYNHISNGGQRQPNKGMNFPTISIGLDRVINYRVLEKKPDELKVYNPSIQFYTTLFSSLRSADEASESSSHLRIGIMGGVIKPLSRVSRLTAGVEIGHDDSYRVNIDRRGLEESSVVSALLLGHQFMFGRVSFFTQFGAYLSRPKTLQEEWVYQNYVLSYNVSDHWALGTGLIAYGNVADHMDFRLIWFW
ncbi:MAG: acyloxyacyl hydrolase [Bacteroidota bacterium]